MKITNYQLEPFFFENVESCCILLKFETYLKRIINKIFKQKVLIYELFINFIYHKHFFYRQTSQLGFSLILLKFNEVAANEDALASLRLRSIGRLYQGYGHKRGEMNWMFSRK